MREHLVEHYMHLRPGDEIRAASDGPDIVEVYREGARTAWLFEIWCGGVIGNRPWLDEFIPAVASAMIACGWPNDIVHTHFLDADGNRVELDDERVSYEGEVDSAKVDLLKGWTWVFTVQERA
ncbi:hypothetical protein GF380_05305 [Candidatus Uhrbacteria bacterium]|nr:hypothetical protein [Candidatus Uhrbacteria bacterium]MBD3284447.1 hypothetical protein [Candidatus Uhrbacteria bacterium]